MVRMRSYGQVGRSGLDQEEDVVHELNPKRKQGMLVCHGAKASLCAVHLVNLHPLQVYSVDSWDGAVNVLDLGMFIALLVPLPPPVALTRRAGQT
jgi:hypothetical protein